MKFDHNDYNAKTADTLDVFSVLVHNSTTSRNSANRDDNRTSETEKGNYTTSGTEARRERIRKQHEEAEKKRVRNMKVALALAIALASGAATIGVQQLGDYVHDNAIIKEYADDLRADTLDGKKNTHRTDDNENFFYDSDEIAQIIEGRIQDGADMDQEVFLVTKVFDYNGPNEIVSYLTDCQCESIEAYANYRGFESVDEFKQVQRDRIIMQEEIAEKQSELQKMQEEYGTSPIQDALSQKGGVKK